ncbi:MULTISPECIES: cbb3-type cytochrome oxidase subunit 3 [unclassified Psychrobacter]|uniref:cbb3-type cytochrome oxidase subunit 3 n=1 Tax=unclassified Psychrobacter TaxID=196806 RepID=UPI0018F4E0F5|nr:MULTISPECIES: cbb3-type cytochrome c oxidase subunit 3 [unclassified Psychrobacter]
MGIGELQTIATVSAFVAFMGVAWWAYSPKNKKRFEEDAKLALDDEVTPSSDEQRNKDER